MDNSDSTKPRRTFSIKKPIRKKKKSLYDYVAEIRKIRKYNIDPSDTYNK